MLKYRETYEIMDPATVGIPKSSLVLGKHSGRHAFRDRVTQLGYTLNDEQLEAAFVKFKALADKKKEVFDEDIEALVDDQLELTHRPVGAGRPAGDGRLQHRSPPPPSPSATATARSCRTPASATARSTRSTPPSSASPASRCSLSDYRIRAVTRGKEAQGEVQIELEHNGRKIRGRGLSTDILEASALAYLAAINRLRSLNNREKLVTQHSGV